MTARVRTNRVLFYFGCLMLLGGVVSAVLTLATDIEVLGINAFIKPMKFYFSVWIFVWTMAYYMSFLKDQKGIATYNWICAVGLGFELLAITFQAAQGKLSHFNRDSAFDAALFSLMGIVITIVVGWTATVAFKFRQTNVIDMPDVIALSVQLAILLSVVFAAEGGVMAAMNSHTVGGPDGGPGLPVINWSTRFGDLRVAHFFGIHALQIIPLLSFYFVKRRVGVVILTIIYFGLLTTMLIQAFLHRPFVEL